MAHTIAAIDIHKTVLMVVIATTASKTKDETGEVVMESKLPSKYILKNNPRRLLSEALSATRLPPCFNMQTKYLCMGQPGISLELSW